MSKLERAVKELKYAEKKLKWFLPIKFLRGLKRLPFPVCDKAQKELYRELIELRLVEGTKYFKHIRDESDYKPTDPVMVDNVTELGGKLIELSEDEEKWEKVKNDDTSVIDDDELKKAVEKLMSPSSP